jgi:hypothetical protein
MYFNKLYVPQIIRAPLAALGLRAKQSFYTSFIVIGIQLNSLSRVVNIFI